MTHWNFFKLRFLLFPSILFEYAYYCAYTNTPAEKPDAILNRWTTQNIPKSKRNTISITTCQRDHHLWAWHFFQILPLCVRFTVVVLLHPHYQSNIHFNFTYSSIRKRLIWRETWILIRVYRACQPLQFYCIFELFKRPSKWQHSNFCIKNIFVIYIPQNGSTRRIKCLSKLKGQIFSLLSPQKISIKYWK